MISFPQSGKFLLMLFMTLILTCVAKASDTAKLCSSEDVIRKSSKPTALDRVRKRFLTKEMNSISFEKLMEALTPHQAKIILAAFRSEDKISDSFFALMSEGMENVSLYSHANSALHFYQNPIQKYAIIFDGVQNKESLEQLYLLYVNPSRQADNIMKIGKGRSYKALWRFAKETLEQSTGQLRVEPSKIKLFYSAGNPQFDLAVQVQISNLFTDDNKTRAEFYAYYISHRAGSMTEYNAARINDFKLIYDMDGDSNFHRDAFGFYDFLEFIASENFIAELFFKKTIKNSKNFDFFNIDLNTFIEKAGNISGLQILNWVKIGLLIDKQKTVAMLKSTIVSLGANDFRNKDNLKLILSEIVDNLERN